MDAYISEAQIISCDELDELSAELIQPGHRTICSAKVKLEINHKRDHTKIVKAKLDSCGSVSIAHSNLMNEIKPAGQYNLPSIRLRGIGGKTNLLNKVGILRINKRIEPLFSTPVDGNLGFLSGRLAKLCLR